MKCRVLLGIVMIVLCCAVMVNTSYAASKVTLNPTSLALTEGNSQTVSVTLDEPIIGPGPGAPYFNLNLTSSNTSRVTISPSPVTYAQSEWAQTKTFIVTALHDGAHNSTNTVTISFVVDSDSEYYRHYSGSLAVTLTDIDPEVVANQSSTPATLADTGIDNKTVQILSMVGFLTSTSLLLVIRRQYSNASY